MKPTKKRTLSLIILGLFFLPQILLFSNPLPVKADDSLWNLAGEGGLTEIGATAYGGETPSKDIRLIAASIIKVFLGLLGIIFLALIITAGYRWMTAGGNEENVNKAKSQIIRAVIGLLIIFAAYAITVFVTDDIRRAITGEVW